MPCSYYSEGEGETPKREAKRDQELKCSLLRVKTTARSK